MTSWRWTYALLMLAALLATTLAGDWCENFETGAGTFWTQPSSQGGSWQHTGYKNESAHGHHVPKPPTGEDGILLLRPHHHSIVVWSMLTSPELQFLPDASIQLDYWLWFNRSQPDSPLSFMLFRQVNGIEDEYAFLNISAYASVYQSHWASIEAGLELSRGDTFAIAIYGYMAGDGPVMSSDLGLDRLILRGVSGGDNPCGGDAPIPTLPPQPEPTNTRTPPTTPRPGPTTPHYDFFCPSQYGLFADPYTCHYFYQCNDWFAVHMECPAELVFNVKTKQCDYKKKVPGC